MAAIQRILVPTDFSPASDIALQYAIDLAQRLGSKIDLLHVVDDASFAPASPDGLLFEIPGLRERVFQDAGIKLKDSVDRCDAAGLVTTDEIVVGKPAHVIAQAAASRETDLIVMGTHGQGALAHLVLGSVAERVIRAAPCAVLTVRDNSRIADVLAAESVTAHKTPQPA